MARSRKGSPALSVQITEEAYARARQSDSGGCLIADSIKTQYPHLTGVTVDMATIRATDRQHGVRYTYLTPPAAQHLLLSFDQGWPNPTTEIRLRTAVKITPIKAHRSQTERKAERLATLEAKETRGEPLTGQERRVLGVVRKTPARPATHGPAEVRERNGAVTVHGGEAIPQGPSHPNLLRGRDRHFGAKLADPGRAFNEAVEAAVAERLADAPATQ